MKNKILIIISIVALLAGSVFSRGDTPSPNRASAGASFRLEQYLNTSGEAFLTLMYKLAVLQQFSHSGSESTETLEAVTYDTPRTGIVCCQTTLNIREGESVMSDVITYAYAKREITVLGEHQVQGKVWYRVEYNGVRGYASSDYIKFGDDVILYLTGEGELVKNLSLAPARLEITDDLSELPDSAKGSLNEAVNRNVNYCLRAEYPKYLEADNYVNVFSILEHILRNYQAAINICSIYGLTNTYESAMKGMTTAGLLLENLVVTTGTTSASFQAQIQQLARQRAKKKELTIGEKIAEYAASFVGILPYVWGGASLTRGADCSGFAAQIYAHFGYIDQTAADRHHYDSRSLRNVGRPVSIEEIQPGDLICYEGHVAIYYGDGKMVDEPTVGMTCRFGSLYRAPILTIRRLVPES